MSLPYYASLCKFILDALESRSLRGGVSILCLKVGGYGESKGALHPPHWAINRSARSLVIPDDWSTATARCQIVTDAGVLAFDIINRAVIAGGNHIPKCCISVGANNMPEGHIVFLDTNGTQIVPHLNHVWWRLNCRLYQWPDNLYGKENHYNRFGRSVQACSTAFRKFGVEAQKPRGLCALPIHDPQRSWWLLVQWWLPGPSSHVFGALQSPAQAHYPVLRALQKSKSKCSVRH